MKTIYLVVLLIFWGVSAVFASVDLEVGTGVLVETTGGVSVEIDGALTKTGTGYFKGTISSGSRTGMTTFAGLALSSGISGTIIRRTGAAYAKGNGEGSNFTRYYELNNTGSSVNSDMQIVYNSSGSNDERNGLIGPYYIYRFAEKWVGFRDGSSASPVSAESYQIPTGSSDWVLSDGSFVTFTDVETAATGSPVSFNEGGGDPGDGRSIAMVFTNLSGSGNVTVSQSDHSAANAPNANVCGYLWTINNEAGITSFSTDLTFHYTDVDVTGYTESAAYFGIAKFNSSTNTWQWLGGTVDAGDNTVTVNGITSFSTFALFRRIFGDITGDGYVDAADLQRLGDVWHQTNSGEFTAGSDARFFNYNKNINSGNQIIDAADLQVFGDCWHNGVAP